MILLRSKGCAGCKTNLVLILVVVDDTLAVDKSSVRLGLAVLILVVVDDTLAEARTRLMNMHIQRS